MSKTSTHRRETRLSLRVSKNEKAILQQAAQVRHTNTSQFVLQACLDVAHAILVGQIEFRLSPEQWEAFCAHLDKPARNIPALHDLFREEEKSNA